MIDNGIIITGVIGIISTIVSSCTTWFFSRRKYNAGVEHDKIENMESSLGFYDKLSDSNQKTLSRLLKESEDLVKYNISLLKEVRHLKVQISVLLEILETELPNVDLSKYGVKIDHGEIIEYSQEYETSTEEKI